ncbi:MAG: (2Fe-2S)-binding protein [Chloroflexota bacterium]|nr:(2Fe-2S)-binding protein [Chloroflexota bacterium]
MSTERPWERLRAPGGQPLTVRPPERITVDALEIDDHDLPAVDGATVINAWREAGGDFVVWAARVDGVAARTYVVRAGALRIRAADASLARLLSFAPGAPPPEIEWSWRTATESVAAANEVGADVVCPCEGITRGQIEDAIAAGARSVDAVKRATKATFGACQARRCGTTIAEMIGLGANDPRASITPRPPLVPVPASILAAFAAER